MYTMWTVLAVFVLAWALVWTSAPPREELALPVPAHFKEMYGLKRRGKSSSSKGGGSGSGWIKGQMTFYWAGEPEKGFGTGSKGANGKQLEAGVSLAVKGADAFRKYKGRRVEIEGMGDKFRVDDYCLGGECKDLDYYVGLKQKKGYDGIKTVRYRFL